MGLRTRISGRISALASRRPVLTFFVLAFGISWGAILAMSLPTGLPGSGVALDDLLVPVTVAMLLGPSLSAIIMTLALEGRAGLWALMRLFKIHRIRVVELLAATCMIPACALVVLLPLSQFWPAYVPGFLGEGGGVLMVVGMLAAGLFVGLIEETGWTGFVTTRLLDRHTVLKTALMLGLIHGIWHFLSGFWMEGAKFGWIYFPYFLTAWIVAIINLRILIVWLFAKTRSMLIAAIAHASHTGALLAIWPPGTSPLQDLLWTGGFAAVGLVSVLAVTGWGAKT